MVKPANRFDPTMKDEGERLPNRNAMRFVNGRRKTQKAGDGAGLAEICRAEETLTPRRRASSA
jgi:hypothetical protein